MGAARRGGDKWHRPLGAVVATPAAHRPSACFGARHLRGCAAFRRQYLYGLAVGMVFGVALIIMYGVYLSAAASPYFIVGFAVGVALGLFMGVWKLRRSWRQLNELREDTMEV